MLVVQGAVALYFDRLNLRVPTSRASLQPLAVLSGPPLLLMVGAMACGVVILLSFVAGHCDRRDNEGEYQAFRWLVGWLGAAFAISALVAHFYIQLTQ